MGMNNNKLVAAGIVICALLGFVPLAVGDSGTIRCSLGGGGLLTKVDPMTWKYEDPANGVAISIGKPDDERYGDDFQLMFFGALAAVKSVPEHYERIRKIGTVSADLQLPEFLRFIPPDSIMFEKEFFVDPYILKDKSYSFYNSIYMAGGIAHEVSHQDQSFEEINNMFLNLLLEYRAILYQLDFVRKIGKTGPSGIRKQINNCMMELGNSKWGTTPERIEHITTGQFSDEVFERHISDAVEVLELAIDSAEDSFRYYNLILGQEAFPSDFYQPDVPMMENFQTLFFYLQRHFPEYTWKVF